MSKLLQLYALLNKNLILMKRNWCATITEIFFPIILMLLIFIIKKGFNVIEYNEPLDDEIFTLRNSTAIINQSQLSFWNGLTIKYPLSICRQRTYIGIIGNDTFNLKKITLKIEELFNVIPSNITYNFKYFEDVNQIDTYVRDDEYGASIDKPQICFGVYFNQINESSFDYSLHYFDNLVQGGIQDVPNSSSKSLDYFQKVPDLISFKKWINSGYLSIYKIINDIILQTITNNPNAQVNFGIVSKKYSSYNEDPFGILLGFMLSFFLVISYLCPLCIIVFRMVKDRETKAKEGMKIMGLQENIYFLSYFFQWIIQNTLYALVISLILINVFSYVGFVYLFIFIWLYGMCIFSLAFFFQSLMDKTRVAMLITILIYFVMFFVSIAVIPEDVPNLPKMLISLFPPTCLQLGIGTITKFEISFFNLTFNDLNTSFANYSISNMYVMLTVDSLLYLFLGYYLQNVISYQFGINKPWYFLCSRNFWFKGSKKIYNSSNTDYLKINESTEYNQNNFQSEKNYDEDIKTGNCLQISNLKKVFDDGKIAVDNLNLNIYKEEIFALLGHNGAGKSTTISILSGLYQASSGYAYYKGMNILEYENMDVFRKKLGICPQHDVLFDFLTIKEHLRMFCIFKGIAKNEIEDEIEKTLIDLQMIDKANDLAKNLSGGEKRKLSVAIALIGGSEVVFLDEPTSGMDITSRRNLWEILKKCSKGRIIVLTTHYMEEAAVLGNRIGIVSAGKLKCCGNPLFLTDRFGKYFSINIIKSEHANSEKIIQLITKGDKTIEYEELTEEILFRIPKDKKDFSFKNFFAELDNELQTLGIKSYGASMPTLEDVFLNVSSDSKSKIDRNVSMDNSLNLQMNDDVLLDKFEETNKFTKFISDLKASLKKRFLQIVRDKKTFILEILCPILLVLIGLSVTSVKMFKDSPSIKLKINDLPSEQNIIINSNYFDNTKVPVLYNDTINKVNFVYINVNNTDNLTTTLYSYNNMLTINKLNNDLGSYYFLKIDNENHMYEYITYINLISRNAPVIFTDYMMNKVIDMAAGRKININYVHHPLPISEKLLKEGEKGNSSQLVFFVSIAFALIPANFITILIKEKETNTKHLQLISGISLSSYWVSNYIFELTKYYFIGGVSLLLMYWFGRLPDYLWILYLLYGLSMISFTYMLSLIFKSESTGQNIVILINFVFGALFGTLIILLRIYKNLSEIAKTIAMILRIFPCFAFSYGFIQMLYAFLLFQNDYPDDFYKMLGDADEYLIKLEYVGMDCLFLAIESVIYLSILILVEGFSNILKKRKTYNINLYSDDGIEKGLSNKKKYSIQVNNLVKIFKGFCGRQSKLAVDSLNFKLEYGECFGLLGITGAGKTTTFKALTSETTITSGEIFINGLEVSSNFNKIRKLIGYCPQFDAIFTYMTVYENLEFYAQIKDIPSDKLNSIISALMKEMNLTEYKNKISGNLSGGNKRKLSVAIAMIGNPPIVLLDEPSTGMDPEARRFMWAVIHKISTRSKLSSVILTTHSMEEAETLCRKMGIMVRGQFKCIGSSQEIKDKYGFGFELDIRIKLVDDDYVKRYMNDRQNTNFNDLNEIKEYLEFIGKSEFITHLNNNLLGREIVEEVSKNKISIKRIIEWVFYVTNLMKCLNYVIENFEDISIVEFYDNFYKLKIKKNDSGKSIGFLFGLIEDMKIDCSLAEYSISQTSLEQIFNKFALEDDSSSLQLNAQKEIIISKKMINNLLP